MALNEFNISGVNFDVSEDGIRIWDKPNDYHNAILISHDDFKFASQLIDNWNKENLDK